MQALLSFDKAPPLAAPLRFFLTAPLFAAAAGLLLLVLGGEVFASRWLPGTLAATHLVTVGFMLQVMLGALIQILPVVAGANLARPLLVAGVVHGGLAVGTGLLVFAFLAPSTAAYLAAAGLLAATNLVFLIAAGQALLAVPSTSPTTRGLKLALLGLAGVVGLGVTLALGLAFGWPLPLPALADLHAGWGLGAWAGVLLAAMAYVVVPMFQLTPGYPARPSWWFPPAIVLVMLLWSAAVALDLPSLLQAAQALAALAGMGFAGFTLDLQRRRRRSRVDATYRYWQLGLASALAALTMLLVATLWPAVTDWAPWTPLFGILLMVGGFMSLIIGMLYKIVPFLSWLHLQNRSRGKIPAPNMNQILPERRALHQMRCHALALALLAAAAILPDWLARPAGLAFVLANGWLFANLWAALGVYRRHVAALGERLAA